MLLTPKSGSIEEKCVWNIHETAWDQPYRWFLSCTELSRKQSYFKWTVNIISLSEILCLHIYCRQWFVLTRTRSLYFCKLSNSKTPVILAFSWVYSLELILRVEAIELGSQWPQSPANIAVGSGGIKATSTSILQPNTRFCKQYFEFNEQVKSLLVTTKQWHDSAHFTRRLMDF